MFLLLLQSAVVTLDLLCRANEPFCIMYLYMLMLIFTNHLIKYDFQCRNVNFVLPYCVVTLKKNLISSSTTGLKFEMSYVLSTQENYNSIV